MSGPDFRWDLPGSLPDDLEAADEGPLQGAVEEELILGRFPGLVLKVAGFVENVIRYSSAEGDILYVVQNAWTDIRTEGLGGYELDPPSKDFLEKEGEINEIVVAFTIRLEFHQDVHVAFRPGSPVDERSEQSNTPHTEFEKTAPVFPQKIENGVPGQDSHKMPLLFGNCTSRR
jgi:hypothetical protein